MPVFLLMTLKTCYMRNICLDNYYVIQHNKGKKILLD